MTAPPTDEPPRPGARGSILDGSEREAPDDGPELSGGSGRDELAVAVGDVVVTAAPVEVVPPPLSAPSATTAATVLPPDTQQDVVPVLEEGAAAGSAWPTEPPTLAGGGDEVGGADAGPRPLVCELISSYTAVLNAVEDLPGLVPLRTRESRPLLSRPLPVLPRPTLFLRTLLAHHMGRTLATLDRAYHLRAALGVAEPRDAEDRAALDHFRRAMPPVHRKTLITTVLLAVLVTGQLLFPYLEQVATDAAGSDELSVAAGRTAAGTEASGPIRLWPLVVALAEAETYFPRDSGQSQESAQQSLAQLLVVSELPKLLEQALSATTFEFRTLGELFNALRAAGLLTVMLLLGYLTLTVAFVLRPLAGAHRLKRVLLNSRGAPSQLPWHRAAPWHVTRSTGVYTTERRLLAELGWRPAHREQPVDLTLMALAPAVLLIPAVLAGFVVAGRYAGIFPGLIGRGVGALVAVVAVGALAGPCVLRLLWLEEVRRQRVSGSPSPWGERTLGGGRLTVLLRRPLSVALLALVPVAAVLFLLMDFALNRWLYDWGDIPSLVERTGLVIGATLLLSAPWWWRVTRELRDLGRLRGVVERRLVRIMHTPAVATTAIIGSAGSLAGLTLHEQYQEFAVESISGESALSSVGLERVLTPLQIAGLVPLLLVAMMVLVLHRRIAAARALSAVSTTTWPSWLAAVLSILAPPAAYAHVQGCLNRLWLEVARGEGATAAGSPGAPPATDGRQARRLTTVAIVGTVLVIGLASTAVVRPAPDGTGDSRLLDLFERWCLDGDDVGCTQLWMYAPVGSAYERTAEPRLEETTWEVHEATIVAIDTVLELHGSAARGDIVEAVDELREGPTADEIDWGRVNAVLDALGIEVGALVG